MDQAMEEKRYPVKHSALFAGGTAAAMGLIDLAANLGPTGLVVGGIASYVAWRHGPEILENVRGMLPLPSHPTEQLDQVELAELAESPEPQGRSWLDRAIGRRPGQEAQAAAAGTTDDVFSLEEAEQALPFVRLSMQEVIAHIPANSYRVYLGRSVLGQGNKARAVNILTQHLKLIGASQYGKSSMAACILEQIISTHDLEHALIAILDLEDRTGNLFADDPHIVTFRMSGRDVKMHARSKEQVLEYLGYILQLMDYRYSFSTTEVEQMPLLIVYIEEFLALKDYYKRRIAWAKTPAEKESFQRDYDDLIYRISELARRGLKARVQLLLCAQVDYRDDDLYEALANITAGMSFCVKPSAAQAAGFTDMELLKRNYKDSVKGQAVSEFSGCKDLILAPEYPLKRKLMALEAKQRGPNQGRSLGGYRDDWTPRPEPGRDHFLEDRDRPAMAGPGTDFSEDEGYTANVRVLPQNGEKPLAEPSDSSPKEYRLSEEEIKMFIAAYKLCGSIEKSLASINRGGWYKKHASDIVRVHGLRKEA